jgi:hypothetical protein
LRREKKEKEKEKEKEMLIDFKSDHQQRHIPH